MAIFEAFLIPVLLGVGPVLSLALAHLVACALVSGGGIVVCLQFVVCGGSKSGGMGRKGWWLGCMNGAWGIGLSATMLLCDAFSWLHHVISGLRVVLVNNFIPILLPMVER